MNLRVLLLQIDGTLPNLALMRLAAHHRAQGDEVSFRPCPTVQAAERGLWDDWDLVYASLIFTRSRPIAQRIRQVYPAIVGGTGWDLKTTLEAKGIATAEQDYSIYPKWRQSIGFTQRGCRLKCSFCCVPTKEGAVREVASVWDIWRGDPWPRELILLDNDFFGQPNWAKRIDEMRAGKFRVNFNQGINARMLTDETAAAIASVDYRDARMDRRRIYTAWDSRKDERRLFAGLESLVRHGVKPDEIMVYMLCGYWKGETAADREYRRRRLREFGCRPYPMPFVRTRELVGFQRWITGAYDKRVSWSDWTAAGYEPRNLGLAPTLWQESP